MKVVKFGGSSIASAEQFKKVRDIISADAKRRIIVVSAPGKRHKNDQKVTDVLIQCARIRLSGRDAGGEVSRVVARYEEIAADLGIPGNLPQQFRSDLFSRLDADASNQDRFEDSVKAAGESYCAQLLAAYLQHENIVASYVSPSDAGLIVTEEYGEARICEESYPNLAQLRDRKGVTVFPGFYGHSSNGNVVTFSRGGSDLTGSILAAAVHADVYENFTDVNGVAAADPRIVDSPVNIERLTYQELRELSSGGFSVFHEEAMLPVFEAEIPINVRNTNNVAHPGTWVVSDRDATAGSIVGVACTHGFCGIYVSKYLMNREKGFGRRLLEVVEQEGLSFDHAPSGVDNLTVVLRQSQLSSDIEERIKKRVQRDLGGDIVKIEHDVSIVSVVGNGMRRTVGIAARVTGALARASVNIEMLIQGPSELAMILGCKAEDAEQAVCAIYKEFFQ